MKTRQLTKKAWEKSYARATKIYGHGQYLLDIPAIKGTMSYSYTNNFNKLTTVFYIESK